MLEKNQELRILFLFMIIFLGLFIFNFVNVHGVEPGTGNEADTDTANEADTDTTNDNDVNTDNSGAQSNAQSAEDDGIRGADTGLGDMGGFASMASRGMAARNAGIDEALDDFFGEIDAAEAAMGLKEDNKAQQVIGVTIRGNKYGVQFKEEDVVAVARGYNSIGLKDGIVGYSQATTVTCYGSLQTVSAPNGVVNVDSMGNFAGVSLNEDDRLGVTISTEEIAASFSVNNHQVNIGPHSSATISNYRNELNVNHHKGKVTAQVGNNQLTITETKGLQAQKTSTQVNPSAHANIRSNNELLGYVIADVVTDPQGNVVAESKGLIESVIGAVKGLFSPSTKPSQKTSAVNNVVATNIIDVKVEIATQRTQAALDQLTNQQVVDKLAALEQKYSVPEETHFSTYVETMDFYNMESLREEAVSRGLDVGR